MLGPVPRTFNGAVFLHFALLDSEDQRYPRLDWVRASSFPEWIGYWRKEYGTLHHIESQTIKRLILRRMKERRRLLPTGRRPLPKKPERWQSASIQLRPGSLSGLRYIDSGEVQVAQGETIYIDPRSGMMTEETKPPDYENVELDERDKEIATEMIEEYEEHEQSAEGSAQLDIDGNEHATMEWSSCARCNRPLTNRESRVRGLGPQCARIMAGQSAGESERELEAARERRGNNNEGVVSKDQLNLLIQDVLETE